MVQAKGRSSSSPGLLQGLRVVELGQSIAAPMTGMLLAEQGAEVVRVVSPRHPGADPVLGAILARGKVERTLDEGRPEDVATLSGLLARADVVLVGDGPEGRPFPDVDLAEVRETVNPGLVTCRIAPFPDDDPRASLPGHEAIAGGAGFLYNRPIGRPWFHEFPMGSVTAALFAADGVVAALIARHRTGRGQDVDTSLLHCNLTAQVVQILIKAGVPRAFLALRMIGSPFIRVWRCGDERWVYLHITLPAHNLRMLELLEEAGYGAEVARLRRIMSPETLRDPSQVKTIKEAKKIKRIYEELFLKKTADEWEEVLGSELCCIKVRTIEEWLRDSMDAGMPDACRVEDPVFGQLLGPGPLLDCPDFPSVVRPRTRDEAAFEELQGRWEAESPHAPPGEPEDEAGELAHPLQGTRVVDLSRVIAGPCAARVLAELGADVLSIQSETRLDWALSFHLVFNAGKRSMTLDFRSDEGKTKLWAVLDDLEPDAFLENYRHLDLARKIGVDPEAVAERFPHIAYTHLNSYGNHGTWKDRPGFEQVVQAVSGIQVAYARGGRPKLLPSPIIDIGCGLLGAFGTLLGLYHRRRTGRGVFVASHLTSVSVLLQILRVAAFQRDEALARARRAGRAVPYDPDREVVADVVSTLGSSAVLAGPRGDVRTWLRRAGLARAGDRLDGRELEVAAKRLKRRPVSTWQASLIDAGVHRTVGLLPCPNIRRVVEDTRRTDPRDKPAVRRRDYPGSPQQLTFVANPLRLSLTPLADVPTPPVRGTHTREVLARIGEEVPEGTGVIGYPEAKPLVIWLGSFVRWGYFAWKSGNI